MYYIYSQNNSGGLFSELSEYILIEARDYDEANEKAETLGIYFDGVENGIDCPCCGDRWNRVTDNPRLSIENPRDAYFMNYQAGYTVYDRYLNVVEKRD